MVDIYIMNHEDVHIETSKGVNMAESPITPRSDDSSNHHFEDQMLSKNHSNVVNKIETEIVEIAEDHQVEDDLTIDIKDILQDKNESLLAKCCIYRVPHGIRKHNPEAYTPELVSIGPLHYGNPHLQNMETHKEVFFKAFMERSHTTLDNLIAIVNNSELDICGCYSEKINLSKRDLVKMILVDAGFIMELFLKIHEGNWYSSDEWWFLNDSTLKTPWFRKKIILDLIMLENQLPFFILEELFNLVVPPHTRVGHPPFLKLTFAFFDYYNVQKLDPSTTPDFSTKHFTDLLRTFHLKQKRSEERSFVWIGNNDLLYSANELHDAGVMFKVNIKNKCLLDLNFSRGVLEIPQIMVQEETKNMFRNMIALEQCHYPFESYICDYAVFWDCLIKTSIDVDILVNGKIIRNFLDNSDEVAKLFNGLGKDILHVEFNADYNIMCKKLNDFYEDPWNNMKANLNLSSLIQDYAKTPWQTIASFAGIVLLILTLVQTICSIIQVA